MLKECHKQGVSILKQSYKYLFFPTFFIMLFNAYIYFIINIVGNIRVWEGLNSALKTTLIFILIVVEFVGLPLASVVFFKLIFLCKESNINVLSGIKSFLCPKNIQRIIAINFIPMLIGFVVDISGSASLSVFNMFIWDSSYIPSILKVINIYINYKFFLCNYHFALAGSSTKETIYISFKTMNLKALKCLFLSLLVLPWMLLNILINFLVRYTVAFVKAEIKSEYFNIENIGYDMPIVDLLNVFWFGFGFFVIPYAYAISFSFLENFIKENR